MAMCPDGSKGISCEITCSSSTREPKNCLCAFRIFQPFVRGVHQNAPHGREKHHGCMHPFRKRVQLLDGPLINAVPPRRNTLVPETRSAKPPVPLCGLPRHLCLDTWAKENL